MKKLKIIIVLLILILIVIVCCLLLANNKQHTEIINEEIPKIDTNLRLLDSKIDYLTVKKCIQSYKEAVNLLLDSNTSTSTNQGKIYSMLDEDYIKFSKLSQNNIQKKYKENFSKTNFYINSVYKKNIDNNYAVYFVYGRELNSKNKTINDYGYIVKLNKEASSFSIFEYDYIKENGFENIKENINSVNTKSLENKNIKENDYNVYQLAEENNQEIAIDYFKNYVIDLRYNKMALYNTLLEEYAEKKFKNYDNFLEYANRNEDLFYNVTLKQFKETKKEETDEIVYTLVDNYNRIYYFTEYALFNYKMNWDFYTIDSEERISTYKTSRDELKVVYNIEKIIQAINDKDYEYAYKYLYSVFKQNNYSNIDDFVNFIESNLYSQNGIDYLKYINEGDINIYDIRIKDLQNEQNGEIKLQIIMRLEDDMNFVYSFSKQ